MFRSHDGRIHRMRVPTYGGASWLTEFSVLTGLSSDAFGGMRQMVQPVMSGRVGETLPQALARCGYRTQMYYPMLKSFLSAGRFFSSIGIGEIFDAKDQKAKQANERDRFYFESMMAQMERHFASSSGPLFAFVETMATHGAYDYVYMPEVDVPPGGPGTPPEMSEYLRRLGMSRMDHEYLRAELQRRFPGRPFLIVHYGDHHPTASKALLGLPPEADIEQVMAADIPLRLITYYAVDGVGYAPPALPDLDLVDSAYLGTIVLQSARLPPSEVYQERARLMRICYGAYYSCPKREEILRFHRRLIESGIISGL
jgi:phosphoglycerol transferase MdoB-like AlkP superfamily enzyme